MIGECIISSDGPVLNLWFGLCFSIVLEFSADGCITRLMYHASNWDEVLESIRKINLNQRLTRAFYIF